MASTSQIWPVDDTTASTWTGPHRVSMVGPSTVSPVHVEPADGCVVLARGLVVVGAGWLITARVVGETAGVVDETAGGVVTVGAAAPAVGSVEAGSAAASPPRATPKPCAVPPVGRSSNATRPAAAEVRTNAGSNRLPSDWEERVVMASPPRLLEVDVVGGEPCFAEAGAARPQQPLRAAQQGDALGEIGYRFRQDLSGERVLHGEGRGRSDQRHQFTIETLSHL